jgi:pyridoxamine 5'-phosphate oxidase
MSLIDLRRDYALARFDEADAHESPFVQFDRWFAEARAALQDSAAWEPNAMTLATVDSRGRPAARIVLLKGMDDSSFTFFTNYESRKGCELAGQPFAALVFYWNVLERQVRIEGRVEPIPAIESDAYFQTRPLGSRLGAIASPQSRVIASREVLEASMAAATAAAGAAPDRPAHWGGYRVTPDYFEFWQGRQSRLHDRIIYRPRGNAWDKARLAP